MTDTSFTAYAGHILYRYFSDREEEPAMAWKACRKMVGKLEFASRFMENLAF